MSFFYLKPVKGDMLIHLLQEIIVKRMEYLQNLSQGNTPFYNEYVIEGSIHDNVGHFTLCIISALLNSSDFNQFFLRTEVLLFVQRISLLSAYDLRCFAKKLLQIIRKLDTTLPFFEPLQKLCRHIMIRNIASHIRSIYHTEDCATYSLKLYFKHCLPFIAKRRVEMDKGFATIPCGRWIQYLTTMFKSGLLHRITQSKKYVFESDPRLAELSSIVKKVFPLNRHLNNKVLRSKDIDKLSIYFPPCMQNLHQYLRKMHRLSHQQRFYYSLYLKDIGMPVEEAIDFWKSEYSQAPNGSHNCVHTWMRDEKKIVYGIRHMYGLEGGRKNYASKCCQHLQNMDYSCHEGGCPFKYFDNTNLIKILHLDVSEPLLAQIFECNEKKMYSSACLLFLKNHYKGYLNCDINSVNLSPVKYYTLICKKVNNK